MARQKERFQWKNQLVNFVAIIIGVYIAYWLTERSEARQLRAQEQQYLKSFVSDLERDIETLAFQTDTIRYRRRILQHFANELTNKINPDSLTQKVMVLYLFAPFIPHDNTFESLKASGNLGLIQDFDLRQDIVALYNQYYSAIRLFDQIDLQQRNSMITPYLLKTIGFSFTGDAQHGSYLQDPFFVNMVYTSYYSSSQKILYDSMALRHGEMVLKNVKDKIKE